MSNLARVVQQLRKDRDQAQRRVEEPEDTAVLMRRAENEGPCQRRRKTNCGSPRRALGKVESGTAERISIHHVRTLSTHGKGALPAGPFRPR
jgi:hypothetical protein